VTFEHDLHACLCGHQASDMDWTSYKIHKRKLSTQEMMFRLLSTPTYFDLLEECELKLVRCLDGAPAFLL